MPGQSHGALAEQRGDAVVGRKDAAGASEQPGFALDQDGVGAEVDNRG